MINSLVITVTFYYNYFLNVIMCQQGESIELQAQLEKWVKWQLVKLDDFRYLILYICHELAVSATDEKHVDDVAAKKFIGFQLDHICF